MSITLRELVDTADAILRPNDFRDYCPNGLQVEGKAEVGKIVSGVTASQAFIDAAIDEGADVIVVHHGFFWKGERPEIVGIKRRRIKRLLENDVSLLAYHLPLDAHPELGNNAQLALRLGFETSAELEPKYPSKVGVYGKLQTPATGSELASRIARVLGREPFYIEGASQHVETIAWCTGAAQGFIAKALEHGVDAYLTGEVSEQTVHFARETGLHFFAAGHHATERYGAQALGEHLAGRFGLEHRFIDIDNPA